MLNNGVQPVKDGFNDYWIPSQTDKSKKYKVTINKGWYSCECPDNSKSHNLCKHILLLKTYFAIKFKAQEVKQNVRISYPCPFCDSSSIVRDGTRKTTMGLKQRWKCNGCEKRFVNEPITNIKGNMDAVTIAMDLYMRGVSYRGIRDHLKQFLGLKVNPSTIMRWIHDYMDKIRSYTEQLHPEVGETWHADEQMVNVKGKHKWVWNCMDANTRFLLSNRFSNSRTTKDARELFQKAKLTAGSKATKVITDGAFAYDKAVSKEFKTYANPKPHERYVSIRQKTGNNNLIERYHGSFRQRDKTMRAFKTPEGAGKYAEDFRTFYNFIRSHEGLEGKTPAQAGKLEVKPEWKELLISSVRQQPNSNTRK